MRSGLRLLGENAMNSNPFVAQFLAEERMKDAMRQAEQIRLIRAAQGSGKSWSWSLPVRLGRKSLLLIGSGAKKMKNLARFPVDLRDWLMVKANYK